MTVIFLRTRSKQVTRSFIVDLKTMTECLVQELIHVRFKSGNESSSLYCVLLGEGLMIMILN